MTGLIRTQLTGLARSVADLKARVREAVAGELGRAVSGAVHEVVRALVAGRPDPPTAYRRPGRWDDDEDDRWGRPGDGWAADPDEAYDGDRVVRPVPPGRHDPPPAARPAPDPGVTVAVAAGVAAARWWAARNGTWLAAAGVGLGVGLLGVLGGPLARAAIAVLAATADILGAADALGTGAARLDHV